MDWAPELSAKLGRPIEEIRSKGLTAYDFSPAHSVEIRDPSGSVSKFKFPFSVVKPQSKQAAVFSEHDGYLEFDLVQNSVVADIAEAIYHQEWRNEFQQFIRVKAERTSVVAAMLFALVGCDVASKPVQRFQETTYSECLMTTMGAGSQLSAEDIRSLCAEATGVIEPRYAYGEKQLTPSNDFTRCYDEEKRELEAKGVADATRLAKLSCKYPEAK